MAFVDELREKLLAEQPAPLTEALLLELYQFQRSQNDIYNKYCEYLLQKRAVRTVADIPYLPIGLFKKEKLLVKGAVPQKEFHSSGTTGSTPSRHFVADIELYDQLSTNIFKSFFGSPGQYLMFALLPSYQERGNSSLIHMVQQLMQQAEKGSQFVLHDMAKLHSLLQEAKRANKPVILWGVTYALLDLAELYAEEYPQLTIIETGGMKGRRKEMVRDELHSYLQQHLRPKQLTSEYGMTELLSQAYSMEDGWFAAPPSLQIHIRQVTDALTEEAIGRTGGINVLDAANYLSCPFIETQDLGRQHESSSFQVLGRFDQSEVRGCNLLVQ